MEFKTKTTVLENKSREISFLRKAVLLSLGLNLVLGIFIPYAFKHKQIVIVPAFFDHPAQVSESTVSASYLLEQTESILFNRYNVTPETVLQSHQMLAMDIYPNSAFYSAFKEVLKREEQAIKDQGLVGAFYITSIVPDSQHLSVKVEGILKKSSEVIGSTNNALAPENKKFLLKYKYTNGLLQLTDWEEIK